MCRDVAPLRLCCVACIPRIIPLSRDRNLCRLRKTVGAGCAGLIRNMRGKPQAQRRGGVCCFSRRLPGDVQPRPMCKIMVINRVISALFDAQNSLWQHGIALYLNGSVVYVLARCPCACALSLGDDVNCSIMLKYSAQSDRIVATLE
jgi:hypothetical protein